MTHRRPPHGRVTVQERAAATAKDIRRHFGVTKLNGWILDGLPPSKAAAHCELLKAAVAGPLFEAPWGRGL